jgi:DNA polymerase-3 subunit gamma/tau
MAVSQDGEVIKKKRVDGPIAYKQATIDPLVIKKDSGAPAREAKLTVQLPAQEKSLPSTSVKEILPEVKAPVTAPASTPERSIHAPVQALSPVSGERKPLTLLEQLKEKQRQDLATRKAKEVRNPELGELKEMWDRFAGLLKEQQKHSVVSSFQLADLSVEEEVIYIGCQSTLNQKFIEGEISTLLLEIKAHFHNNNIKVKFNVMEGDIGPKVLEAKYLSSVERFRMMAEEYPLVKELKDKLKLELKY